MDTDAELTHQLLTELAFIRLHPFGDHARGSRLAELPILSACAQSLFGTKLKPVDQEQAIAALLRKAAQRMNATEGSQSQAQKPLASTDQVGSPSRAAAALAILGLTGGSSGKSLGARHQIAGALHPDQHAASSMARRQYWEPLLSELAEAVMQIQDTKSLQVNTDIGAGLIDRKEVRERARKGLEGSRRGKLLIIEGEPGIGKSTAATFFLASYRVGPVHVLRVDHEMLYHRDVHEFLGLHGVDPSTWNTARCEIEIAAVLAAGSNRVAGLVVDGISDADELVRLLPETCVLPTIATTRRALTIPGISRLHILAYKPHDAVQVIRAQLPRATDNECTALAAELENHPFAIQQAVGFIRNAGNRSVGQMLDLLHDDRIGTTLRLPDMNDAGVPLERLFRRLIDELRIEDDAFQLLVQALALGSPDVMASVFIDLGEHLVGKSVDHFRIRAALKKLQRTGFVHVQKGGKFVSFNPLSFAVMRQLLLKEVRENLANLEKLFLWGRAPEPAAHHLSLEYHIGREINRRTNLLGEGSVLMNVDPERWMIFRVTPDNDGGPARSGFLLRVVHIDDESRNHFRLEQLDGTERTYANDTEFVAELVRYVASYHHALAEVFNLSPSAYRMEVGPYKPPDADLIESGIIANIAKWHEEFSSKSATGSDATTSSS